jgi:TonB family protein
MGRWNRIPVASLLFLTFVPSLAIAAHPNTQETPSAALPEAQMRDLAIRVLTKAGKAGCRPPDCRILVANFTLHSGATSKLGIQLADAVSHELATQHSAIQVIDRSLLRAYVEQERIPAQVFNNEKVMQWLGKQFGASTVLEGTTWEESGSLHVRVNLLSCEKHKRGSLEELIFSFPDLEAALGPVEPYSMNPMVSQHSIPKLSRAGLDGVSSPRCVYCPQPSYTNPARGARIEGTALFDVVVSAEGLVTDATILRGLPFGLNEASMSTIRNWKFKPSTLEGKPITAMVQIEVTFHLY